MVKINTIPTFSFFGNISVPINDFFCSKSAVNTFYNITITIDGSTPSWLSVESSTQFVVGTTTMHGKQFIVGVNINVNEVVYTRYFILNINA
jgi:hypothetical protein